MKKVLALMIVAAAGMVVALPAPMVPTACASVTLSGEMIDNPMYQNWSKFKVGTLVKSKSVSEMMGNKSESTITYKLVELTTEKVVIEMTSSMKMGDQSFDSPPQKMDFTAKVEKPKEEAKTKDEVKPITGEEELTVAGTKYKCKWSQVTMEQDGNKTTTKSWTCDDFPGIVVKSEMKMEGGMTMTSSSETIEVTIVK